MVRALEVIAGASETGAFRKSSDTGHASSGAKPGTRTIALPLEPAVRARPWVLKMHGDADHPGSIVLTRHDYMRFDRDSGPSAAVVQSRMLTGHLIFVGYLMTDENVIRLAREVQRFREAYEGGEVGPGTAREGVGEVVGTVIGAFPPGLREDLWLICGHRREIPGSTSDRISQARMPTLLFDVCCTATHARDLITQELSETLSSVKR